MWSQSTWGSVRARRKDRRAGDDAEHEQRDSSHAAGSIRRAVEMQRGRRMTAVLSGPPRGDKLLRGIVRRGAGRDFIGPNL